MSREMSKFWREIYEQTNKFYNRIFVVSAVFLSVLLTLNYSVVIEYTDYTSAGHEVDISYAMIAMLVAIPIYWYFAYKRDFVKRVFENFSLGTGFASLFFTTMLSYQMYVDTQRNFDYIIEGLENAISAICWEEYIMTGYYVILPAFCVIAIFAMFVFVSYVLNMFYAFFKEFADEMDKSERIFLIIALAGALFVIGIFYSSTTLQWNSLDLIYQTDTTFIYNNYYPVFSYGYDFDWDIGNGGIRHPLATLCMYPIYIVVTFLAKILFWIPNIQAVLYAVIQVMMMIVTIILLKRMIKSNYIYWIFLVSFPFCFFSIFVEKYQISTLLIVMYVYSVIKKKEQQTQKCFLFAASGMMITSALLGIFYGEGKTWKERAKEYLGLFGMFLAVLVATGRIGYLLGFKYLLGHNFLMFNGQELFSGIETGMTAFGCLALAFCGILMPSTATVQLFQGNLDLVPEFLQRLCSFFNLLASCFVPVSYEAGERFYWTSIYGELNLLGVILFAIVIVVFIKHRTEKIVQIFGVWILWAFVQFGLIGFSAGCSPLFSLYFGWAVIPMVLIGAKDVLKKPLQQFLVYGIVIVMMLGVNFLHLEDLHEYMLVTEYGWDIYDGFDGKKYYCGNGYLNKQYTGYAKNRETGEVYWFSNGIVAISREAYNPLTGDWYYFDEEGEMVTDTDLYIPYNGEPRVVRYDSEGRMVKGEDYKDGKWYRFDEKTGAMIFGEYWDEDGNYYYYDMETGELVE